MFIVDDNPLKQGFCSPGKHIPVCSSEKIYSEMPNYIVILAWNFSDSIMKKHQNKYLLKKRLEVLKYAKVLISGKGLTQNRAATDSIVLAIYWTFKCAYGEAPIVVSAPASFSFCAGQPHGG